MPTTRKPRTSTGPVAKGSQQTLAFNQSKISKPTDKSLLVKDKDSESSSKPVVNLDLDLGHTSSPVPVPVQIPIQTPPKVTKTRTEEEEKASKITDAQIRKYWKAREAERKAARVHQEDLSVEEKVLRLFDMSNQYGPCIGITRVKRWNRAHKIGLSPPIEVLAVLLMEEERGNEGIEKAYVDELI